MSTILDDFRLLASSPLPSLSSSTSYCHLENNKACLDAATHQAVILWQEQSKCSNYWVMELLAVVLGFGIIALGLVVGSQLWPPILDHHIRAGTPHFWMVTLLYLIALILIAAIVVHSLIHHQFLYTEYAANQKGIWIAHKKTVQFYDFSTIDSFKLVHSGDHLSHIQAFQQPTTILDGTAIPSILLFELRYINDGLHRLKRLDTWRQAAHYSR